MTTPDVSAATGQSLDTNDAVAILRQIEMAGNYLMVKPGDWRRLNEQLATERAARERAEAEVGRLREELELIRDFTPDLFPEETHFAWAKGIARNALDTQAAAQGEGEK
jgi:hypothetical protein